MEIGKCQICGKEELTPDFNAYTMLRVCEEHKDYQYMRQVEKLKDSLGYESEWALGKVQCDISGEILTSEEMKSVDFYDAHVTSEKYRAVRKWQQSDFAIKWFDYIKEYPEANIELPQDVALYIEWTKKRTQN